MEGQHFSKILQTTRILALGAALTLCALATGSLGFKVYTHLSEVRQIDANLSDRHLHKLSLDYERLHFTYSQNSNGPLLDGIRSDIFETINKVQSHNVIQNKILQAQVTLFWTMFHKHLHDCQAVTRVLKPTMVFPIPCLDRLKNCEIYQRQCRIIWLICG